MSAGLAVPATLAEQAAAAFLVFCRLGACLMVMPGLSSLRLPARIRLLLALALSLALAPLLMPSVLPALAGTTLAVVVAAEVMTGALIGLLGRLFHAALQFAAVAAASLIGIGQIPGLTGDDGEAVPEFAALIGLAATVLVFVLDLHWQVIAALVASYEAVPAGAGVPARLAVAGLAEQAARTFAVAIQACGPFIVYGVVVNLAVGLAGKLTPQIPAYFIALPAVVAGGLLLAWAIAPELLAVVSAAFAGWLARL